MVLQSVMFRKAEWSSAAAKKWLREHHYAPIKKEHDTEQFRRFRMAKPVKDAHYRLKPLPDSIVFVLMYPAP